VPGRRRRRGAERGAGQPDHPGAPARRGAAAAGAGAARRLFAPRRAGCGRPWRLALYALALVAGSRSRRRSCTRSARRSPARPASRPALESWISLAAVAIAHVLVLRVVERRPVADVGLGRDAARPRTLAAGLALGALAIAVPTAVLLAAGQLRVEPAPARELGRGAASLVGWRLAPAALFEELLVRGYPFLVLRESLGALPGAARDERRVRRCSTRRTPGATSGRRGGHARRDLPRRRAARHASLWAAWAAHLAWNATIGPAFTPR
jgi:hypothetical protein